MSGGMSGKALVFVTGSRRPAVAPLTARFVRTHPDGSPMLAKSTGDTIEAAVARWEKAQAADKAAPKRAKEKGVDYGDS